MKKFKLLLTVLFTAFLVLGMMPSASAITIDPDTTVQWAGTVPGNPSTTDVATIVGDPGVVELHKYDFYINQITDDYPDALYLLVKDGEGQTTDPPYYWYIFDLSELYLNPIYADNVSMPSPYDWNGTDTINLANFWGDGGGSGAISHVTVYGGTPSVPEPATMILLGTGLLGLAGFRRKFRK